MTRQMLDSAWSRYPAALGTIRQGEGSLEVPPAEVLIRVAHLLDAQVPIRATLLLFVGTFDGNAYTAPDSDGVPTVAFPIEGRLSELVLAHKFTHVVNGEQAGLWFGWERSIAHTVFTEGLAMRATQALYPGRPDKDYTGELTPGWFGELNRDEVRSSAT